MAVALLDELDEIDRLCEAGRGALRRETVCHVECGDAHFEVPLITLGNPDPSVPAVGFFGGVHGLERIGAEVVIAHLASLVQRLRWDSTLANQLETLRLVFMPIVNPGGLWRGTRANPQGVDLMRNAPVEALDRVPPLVGGQRLSAALPWYRGAPGAPMQVESAALCAVVERELLPRPFALALDCHSGFGVLDRLWFPYAHTARPIEHLAEVQALGAILDDSQPYHRYRLEPQSHQYLTHGDLWDHLYRQCGGGRVFLPLTLEMGSWLWVRKNPRQLLSRHGLFNPLIEHRQQRVLRRHMACMDFLQRAATSHARWRPVGPERDRLHAQALERWYRQ